MEQLKTIWHNLTDSLEERWIAFNSREQKIISLLASVVAIWLIYNLVVQPALSAREQAEIRFQASQKTYQQAGNRAIKIAERLGADNQSLQSSNNGTPLDSRVSESAGNRGITIQSINQQNQGLALRLAPVSFNRLTQWLIALDNEQIEVTNLQMVAGKKTGIVEVRQLQLKAN